MTSHASQLVLDARLALPDGVAEAISIMHRASAWMLLAGADPILAEAVRAAQKRGDGILMVGCAPADVVVDGAAWTAIAIVVLCGDPARRRLVLSGTLENRGRILSATTTPAGVRS